MKKPVYTFASLVLFAVAANASAQTSFRADLDGSMTVPPTATTATGTCTGILNAEQTEYTFSCTHDLLNANKGHIHRGVITDPPSSDTVVFGFAETDCCPESSTWALTPADAADLQEGRLYVNIHSVEFTSEAIRGLLVEDNEGNDDSNGDAGDNVPFTGICGSIGTAGLLMMFCGLMSFRVRHRYAIVTHPTRCV